MLKERLRHERRDRAVEAEAGGETLPGNERAADADRVDIDAVFGGDNFRGTDGRASNSARW